ncbi:hypothetical protein J7M28_07040 [bacterium]|nr:hypothetical protein [bacterium]
MNQDDKNTSRGISRDMSPEAISRRLKIVSDLRILSLKLGRAKKLRPEATSPRQSEPAE